MAAKKEDKKDVTPTRLQHDGGAFVTVPAYKVDGLLRKGFTKPAARRSASN